MGGIAEAIEGAEYSSAVMAESIIRGYCGWHVAPVIQEEITLDQGHTSSKAYLPTMRIVGVHAVASRCGCDWKEIPLCDLSHTGVTFSKNGILEYRCGKFCRGLNALTVNLTHGFDVEDVTDVIAVAKAIARRIDEDNGVKHQSVNGASVTYFGAEDGAGRGVGLLETEKAILDKYKLGGELGG